jgi:CubicO group peptidase (beta-lactamase class C family)
LKALAAAGGVCSSANDMLRYLRANMGIVQTPLSERVAEGSRLKIQVLLVKC